MQEDLLDNDGNIFDSTLDKTTRANLKNIALWATISAIANFAGLLLTIVQLVYLIKKFSSVASSSFSSLISIIISLVMNVILLMASLQIRKALNTFDQSLLNRGLANFKIYFKVYGILLILAIAIVLMTVVYFSTRRGF
jgi:hypothetical protein